jgi:hypothetical protein
MSSKIQDLDREDVAFIRSKIRYALEMASEDIDPYSHTPLLYLVEKAGHLLGLSSVDVEIREAKLRLGK